MHRPNTHLDLLLMELIGYDQEEYELLYFDLGSEWQVRNGGWKLWGCHVFERWWLEQWHKMVSWYIDALSISDDGRPYYFARLEGGEIYTNYRKDFLRLAFDKLAHREMLESKANQAVMELSMHRIIKQQNQSKQ